MDGRKVNRIGKLNKTDLSYLYYNKINSLPVKSSSNVRSIGYSDADKVLFVEFKSGKLYAYSVPPYVFNSMLGAPSQGTYVYDYLRGAHGVRKPDKAAGLDTEWDYVEIH